MSLPEFLICFSSPRENTIFHRRFLLRIKNHVKFHDRELSLKELTYRNMVAYFSDELEKVHNGEKSSKFFNDKQRRKLKDLGILVESFGYKGKRLLLSEKTQKILGLEKHA